MLQSFQPNTKYLVVTPLLSEVERIVNDASVTFVAPETSSEYDTKEDHLVALVEQGYNIATTHKMFEQIAYLISRGLLRDYEVHIDEVIRVAETIRDRHHKKPKGFQHFHLDQGYATLSHDNRIVPTHKWHEHAEDFEDYLDNRLYQYACNGLLYWHEQQFFIWAIPEKLLTSPRVVHVYTYLSEGSMLLAYLRRQNIAFQIDRLDDLKFRQKARELITIKTIPALERVRFSHSAQTCTKDRTCISRTVSAALKNLWQRQLKDAMEDPHNVLITCAKENWHHSTKVDTPGYYATGSGLYSKFTWIPNTTRGTNEYINAHTLIYLYDQNPEMIVGRWLHNSLHRDTYALTELIQWIYRSRVRRSEPITVYLPSERMRRILEAWISADLNDNITQEHRSAA